MVLPKLTERQIEVLQALAEGLTTEEAARRLCICEKTVRSHTRNIYDILGVFNRVEAVVLCAGVYIDIDATRAVIVQRVEAGQRC